MIRWARLLLPLLGSLSCSDATTELIGGREDGSVLDAGALDSAAGPETPCGDRPCACNDGSDQDGDELIDGLDPECTGPFDDDESSFATGIPGTNLDFCQDCYWDQDALSDDDGCAYHTDCLFGETPTEATAAGCGGCGVSEQCASTCGKRTPNGCDCFGCCTVTTADGPIDVLLSDSCSLRDLEDETKCPRCVQNRDCQNTCGTCELCPGRKRRDLPMQCRGNRPQEDPENVCDEGQQVCSEDQPCPTDFYCQLGCCLYVVQ